MFGKPLLGRILSYAPLMPQSGKRTPRKDKALCNSQCRQNEMYAREPLHLDRSSAALTSPSSFKGFVTMLPFSTLSCFVGFFPVPKGFVTTFNIEESLFSWIPPV